ncbi:MAG: hypothetical protein AAF399_09875 [Bacteroidota bacterium]
MNRFAKLIFIPLTVLTLIGVGFFPRTGLATLEEAKRAASKIYYQLLSLGFNVRDTYTTGTLDNGESTTFSRTFYSGNDYALVVGGCNYSRDIDVYIYDRYWNLIDKDTDTDQVAVATFTAWYTGTYYIKVRMYDATNDGVHWALQYAYR